jgi:translation initiation factor eIF-2B subunit beta
MANGGLIAITGSRMMATCAAQHSTPVVVLSGLYKLTPSFPSKEDLLYEPISPASILPYDDPIFESDGISVLSPYYDYVDPRFVTLFLTNVGGHPPSYIYRLLNEFYDPVDNDIDQ